MSLTDLILLFQFQNEIVWFLGMSDRKLLFIAWCRSSKPHHGPFTFQLFRKIKAEKCEGNVKEAIFHSANNVLQHTKPNTAFYLCECYSNLDL